MQGHLAGGYQLRNPPLYEWLLWAVQQLFGPGPLSYLVLRYSLIAAIGILFYVALRRTVASERLAAAFSLSLVLFFWFGWEIHHSVSHTLALLAASLALWIASLAYAERRTAMPRVRARPRHRLRPHGQMELPARAGEPRRGVRPRSRHASHLCRSAHAARSRRRSVSPCCLSCCGWRMPISVSSPAAPCRKGGACRSIGRYRESLAFVAGIPLVFLPWILIVLAFARRFRRQPSEPATVSTRRRSASPCCTAALVLGLMALILLGVTLSGATLFGITHFAIHYLFPFCLFAALGLAGLVAARVDAARFAPTLAVTSLIAAVAIFIVKLASFSIVPPGSEATNLIPYAALAEELTQRGLGSAQFVTLSPREAGNLAIYLPNARALSLSARIEPPPPDPVQDRPCVLLWGGEYSVPPDGATSRDARCEQVSEVARRRGQRGRSRGGGGGLAEAVDRRAEAVGVASLARQLGRGRLPACRTQGPTLGARRARSRGSAARLRRRQDLTPIGE